MIFRGYLDFGLVWIDAIAQMLYLLADFLHLNDTQRGRGALEKVALLAELCQLVLSAESE